MNLHDRDHHHHHDNIIIIIVITIIVTTIISFINPNTIGSTSTVIIVVVEIIAVSIVDDADAPNAPLQAGQDQALAIAVQDGVPSIVLKTATPRAARKAISLLLNRLHHVRWDLGDDGELYLTSSAATAPEVSQFEALSKVMDAEELSVLVRTKMGIDVTEAKEGYASRLNNSGDGRRDPRSRL